ncbi:uncharacterized protein LOC135843266 [Planococcus citri]|uniref:uncharacterized protein LOC135843266 n=1 Tax=Planococcus citri TaxID=170843 RepID=UPI0031F7A9B8
MASMDVFFVIFIWTTVIPYSLAQCYLPDYLQGDFSMQSPKSVPGQVKYEPVSITAEGVSLWGYCKQKIGNGLYLIESSNGTYSTYCLRCFHISVKSQNIVLIRLAGHTDRCFVSSQAAESSCPKPDQLEPARQIILFKNKEEIRKEYCPINGQYTIHYRQNKPDYPIECSSRSSQLDNCPVGSEMNIRFRDCQFENHDLVFECLGSWDGPNQQRYLALFDTRTGTDPRPQYRCGLYREDPGSGTVYIAFSSDSTCTTDLQNSQAGFETLILTKIKPRFPFQLAGNRGCRFPSWTEGRWELVNVLGKIFSYTDLTLFKKYTFQCVEEEDGRDRIYSPYSDDERVLVVGRTECNEEMYTCIWLKKRGENVLEFQLATETSQYPNNSLCSVQNFQSNVWITQGRKDLSTLSPCPILGEYIGQLPNVQANFCAKLSSNCLSQDTMYYTVSDCTPQQIYEEREYRCLGQWKENDYTYTFTQRKDTGTYECFVGTMISESEISVREAGKNCERNMTPLMLEMRLTRKSSCAENRSSTAVFTSTTPTSTVPVTTTKYTVNKRIIQHTTRPWRPSNVTRLPPPSRNKNGNTSDSSKIVPLHLSLLFILHVFSLKCFYNAFTSL